MNGLYDPVKVMPEEPMTVKLEQETMPEQAAVVVATAPSLAGVVPSPAEFQKARLPRVGVAEVAIEAVSVPEDVMTAP